VTARVRRAAGRRRGPWIAIAGTRPNYVKLAPLVRAAAARGRRLDWIETAQHTAPALSRWVARDVRLSAPVCRVVAPPAGRGRIARLASDLATELGRRKPSLVVVVGDVDTTLAGAWAAWQLDLPLVHVEAGLRCFEPDMPEERNRVLVDAMSDRLYLSEGEAEENLRAEGVARSRIRKPGNVMADALRHARTAILQAGAREVARLDLDRFGIVTLHRQANVDEPRRISAYARALARVARDIPLVFPAHPRTLRTDARLGWVQVLRDAGVLVEPPLPYLAFLGLVARAQVVVTDSGGLQVEAALLGTRCVTARKRTEHQLTLRHGGNRLAGTDPRRLPGFVRAALEAAAPAGRSPRAWDGRAAERIVADWCKGFGRPPRLPGPPERLIQAL